MYNGFPFSTARSYQMYRYALFGHHFDHIALFYSRKARGL